MSELRNRTLVPPPPRHPAIGPPSPNPQRSNILNAPPPPVHPSRPMPSLVPRPPSPRPDSRLVDSDLEPTSRATASPDVPHILQPQRSSPTLHNDLHSISGDAVASTQTLGAKPAKSLVPNPSTSSELPPPISRTSSFGSTADSPIVPPPVDHARKSRASDSESHHEATLSEKELRDLYDDEEIDRFLRLFTTFVSEVKLNDGGRPTTNAESTVAAEGNVEDPEDNDDKDWMSLSEVGESLSLPHDCSQPQTMSDQIAQKFVMPYLPKTTNTIPPFTVLRFLLTMQRLCLALEPGFQFIVENLVTLALWEDKNWSLVLCLGYWVLWLYNLLLPTFIFYFIYLLLLRRLYPYPTLAQLREHRRHTDNASEFGEELERRLTATTPFGILDAWKTMGVYNKNKVRKAKEKMKQFDDTASVMSAEATVTSGDEITQEQGIKKLGLATLSELVDGLERAKNIFLWKKPSASNTFGIVLGVIGFATLILPAQSLAKIAYFVLGFAFWHISPVLAALPAGDHRRIFALSHSIPTDADCAMELIAQRVSRGQEINPLNRKRKPAKKPDSNSSPDMGSPEPGSKLSGFLRQGVSVLKSAAGTGYQAIGGQHFIHNNFAPVAARDAENGRSYPAQRGKVPGVITVSSDTFYFTPLFQETKLEIPMQDIVGIMKARPKGISIRVRDQSQGLGDGERKEKFMLVYERDELFWRLVGTGDKRWKKV